MAGPCWIETTKFASENSSSSLVGEQAAVCISEHNSTFCYFPFSESPNVLGYITGWIPVDATDGNSKWCWLGENGDQLILNCQDAYRAVRAAKQAQGLHQLKMEDVILAREKAMRSDRARQLQRMCSPDVFSCVPPTIFVCQFSSDLGGSAGTDLCQQQPTATLSADCVAGEKGRSDTHESLKSEGRVDTDASPAKLAAGTTDESSLSSAPMPPRNVAACRGGVGSGPAVAGRRDAPPPTIPPPK